MASVHCSTRTSENAAVISTQTCGEAAFAPVLDWSSEMYSRPTKTSHLHTVEYEIDMLYFCFGRLHNPLPNSEEGDRNACIEAFLLHYRNLLDFFSDPKQNNDLSIAKPQDWLNRQPTEDDIAMIHDLKARTIRLRDLYLSARNGSISKYLQHCTTQRFRVPLNWPIEDMVIGLQEVLRDFCCLIGKAFAHPMYALSAAKTDPHAKT
jgi:hypothetical protein